MKEDSFMPPINVVIYGCGVMGRLVTKALLEKKSFKIVGAVDVDPSLVGRDLGEFLSPRKELGVRITSDAPGLFAKAKAQAVVLTTTSHLKSVLPQIEQCLKARLNVVSTCEELSYPCRRSPGLTRKIDGLARKYGVTVVGTGINPGYLMDTLPLTLTAPCLKVNSIKVKRMMDSSKRRIPFQAKVGTGLSQKEFRRRIDNKVITGHVGLLESAMIADGWLETRRAVEFPLPLLSPEEDEDRPGRCPPGKVVGLISRQRQMMKEVISSHLSPMPTSIENMTKSSLRAFPTSGIGSRAGCTAISARSRSRSTPFPGPSKRRPAWW
jgi:4-hydroxy-tetrahydrodipicolinate reductase